MSGAFGSGLAILSRYPIVDMATHMFSLTGSPVLVHHGDWIAGKACGCVTVEHPAFGLVDIWNTHVRVSAHQFTAVGGQVGPDVLRAYRAVEAFELAQRCRASAERGRHVLCVGDMNSLPDSLCMALLQSLAGLHDTYVADAAYPDAGITCDSPANTWTAGKDLDESAIRNEGKRLDYILYRGPAHDEACRWECVHHRVVFTEPVAPYGVSLSDHFGVEATFSLTPPRTLPLPTATAASDVLERAAALLREALQLAQRSKRTSLRLFAGFLCSAAILLAANSCAGAWLAHGRSVAPLLVTAGLLVPVAWAGTTALYDGVVWGEWQKRTYGG